MSFECCVRVAWKQTSCRLCQQHWFCAVARVDSGRRMPNEMTGGNLGGDGRLRVSSTAGLDPTDGAHTSKAPKETETPLTAGAASALQEGQARTVPRRARRKTIAHGGTREHCQRKFLLFALGLTSFISQGCTDAYLASFFSGCRKYLEVDLHVHKFGPAYTVSFPCTTEPKA